jgi:hypothetical protein
MSSITNTSSFHNPKYAECIEACNHSANSCQYCGTLCLREANNTLLECVELCFYCADVCRFSSKHMSRDSNRVKEFCDYCTKVCEDCAEECDEHGIDHCKQCAKL